MIPTAESLFDLLGKVGPSTVDVTGRVGTPDPRGHI